MNNVMGFFLAFTFFLSLILRIYFIGFDIFVLVPFGSILLFFLLAFIFSGQSERLARLIFLILYLSVFAIFIYYSASSYLEKETCRGYEDYRCIVKRAVKENNSSLCDLAKDDGVLDEASRSWCYRDLSKNWKDISICEKIVDKKLRWGDYYDCVSNIAKNTNNSSLCEKIDYDERFSPNKKDCYSNF